MTPDQLRAAMQAIGLVQPDATDAQVQQAWAQYQQQNPAGAQTILQQNGVSSAPTLLVWLGIGALAVAGYFIWDHYRAKQTHSFVSGEDDEGDEGEHVRHTLKGMGKSLGAFRQSNMRGCRSPRRMRGLGSKYEFEPETRLEGLGRKRR